MNFDVRLEDGSVFTVIGSNNYSPAVNLWIRREDGSVTLFRPSLPQLTPVRVEDGSIQKNTGGS